MTTEQKQQLAELLKLQKQEESKATAKRRRDAEAYVKERFGISFKQLNEMLNGRDKDEPEGFAGF